MEDIEVSFPGGGRVDARVGSFVVHTDQPVEHGGGGDAVAPFDLFLASLATCAGFYVQAFCRARNIPIDGLGLRQSVVTDPVTHLPSRIQVELRLPASFPEKYRVAVVRAAEGCKVRKTMVALPAIEVVLSPEEPLAHAS